MYLSAILLLDFIRPPLGTRHHNSATNQSDVLAARHGWELLRNVVAVDLVDYRDSFIFQRKRCILGALQKFLCTPWSSC